MADNSITLVGNLTRDPELRFTTGGRGVASFGIAVSRRYQVNGEWQEQTSYFNIVAWGQLGENAASSLTKGMRVVVSGRLEQREYQNREGEKRTAIEITLTKSDQAFAGQLLLSSATLVPTATAAAADAVATAADSVVATLAATPAVATTSQPTKNPSDLF